MLVVPPQSASKPTQSPSSRSRPTNGLSSCMMTPQSTTQSRQLLLSALASFRCVYVLSLILFTGLFELNIRPITAVSSHHHRSFECYLLFGEEEQRPPLSGANQRTHSRHSAHSGLCNGPDMCIMPSSICHHSYSRLTNPVHAQWSRYMVYCGWRIQHGGLLLEYGRIVRVRPRGRVGSVYVGTLDTVSPSLALAQAARTRAMLTSSAGRSLVIGSLLLLSRAPVREATTATMTSRTPWLHERHAVMRLLPQAGRTRRPHPPNMHLSFVHM